jgi:hypothetical protein
MSYDLVFWRQDGPIDAPPETIYERLLEGNRVDGLLELRIESILTALLGGFPGAVREPNGAGEWIDWTADGRNASFQAEWSPQYVVVSCRGTTNEEMNRLIDIGVAHDCRLYDPQVGERFD